MNTPRLLQHTGETSLPRQIFTDLQLDAFLQPETVTVLQEPCGKEEILCRQELFRLLEDVFFHEKILCLFTALREEERILFLLRENITPLERYHLYADLYTVHIQVSDQLKSMSDCGKRFAQIMEYFSSAEKQRIASEIQVDLVRLASLLSKLRGGCLSFFDKHWITPPSQAVTEYDIVVKSAKNLGLSVSEIKDRNVRADNSLSDAVCRLNRQEVSQIESILAKYGNSVFYEPVSYIPEIRFFLDIHDLICNAGVFGIPHCFPQIAKSPAFTAKEMYDISLLRKTDGHIVPNDADFSKEEPFFFLTGANGGGKTTFLRAVGISLILFLSGCPIFASEASVYPFAFLSSHFPKDERFDNTGRLDEERKRTEKMLDDAEGKTSFLLFNETYSGTDDMRGFSLLIETVQKMHGRGIFGLYVTHFHKVTDTEYPLLSAEIDAGDDNKRTYRIVKAKGAASSYAADILKKYRLDKESLRKRRNERGNSSFESK